MKKVSEYFKSFPKSHECFQTSDGLLFHLDSDARNHAKTLDDDAVKHHERADVKTEEAPEEEPVIGETGKKAAAKKTK